MRIKYKLIIPIGLIALLAAGCSNSSSSSTNQPATSTPEQTPAQMQPAPTPEPTTSTSTTQTQQAVVTYTDSGFSPKTLTIKKGETVLFKNTASDDMRVASNPHPIHNGYPTTGGCVSSTFDSCNTIAPGQSWSFTFDIVGRWGYHNHLNPTEGGTIVVQ